MARAERGASETISRALALGVVLEATVCYRAVTQSITYDEAAAYLKFLRGPLTDVFTYYDASNHVLFTALARVSSAVFGVSALRLPSVIAAAGFFVAIVAVCRRLFGTGVLALLAVAMVALNPFVLDLISIRFRRPFLWRNGSRSPTAFSESASVRRRGERAGLGFSH